MVPAPRLRVARSGPTVENAADAFAEIDGTSAEVQRLKHQMWCVARDPDITVLLSGESGTGKERVARAIHRVSPRAGAAFVVIDCAGLSATLAEDTLFGHVRGAFTGAIDERPGPFERAHGGTILLDEIGDLPLELQMKLLRALQSRTIQRLGARQETPFDARIIAATNVDLAAARAGGRFRDDLYYRLHVFEIAVPALRRRGAADIRALVTTLLQRLADRRRLTPPRMDAAAMDALVRHRWPGNVRELENTLERMLVAAAGSEAIMAAHLPDHLRERAPVPAAPFTRTSPGHIREVLQRHAFRIGRAAAELGLSRHQLYRLVKRHGILPAGQDA